MSKRLQILLKYPEYREIQCAALSRNMSVNEWVRLALRLACGSEPSGSVTKKLETIRAAARLEYPTADINRMLGEIGREYSAGTNP